MSRSIQGRIRRKLVAYVALSFALSGGAVAFTVGTAQADVATFGQGDCFCTGVAADSTGVVYSADPNAHQIVQFSATGSVLARWGTNGTGNGQFQGPEGFATDSNNNVYVADPQRGDVQELSSSGTYIQKFTTNNFPRAVAVDPSSNVYVAGSTGNIYKYNSSGTLLSTWQSAVGGNPAFSDLRGIAYSPANGDVYAVDFNANEVLEFTTAGSFVRAWGTFGNSPGQLNDPYGLAVDQGGNVYVSQPNLIGTNAPMIIQKFTGTGTYLSFYKPPGQPAALSYTAPSLYVAEWSNIARINLSTPIPRLSASHSTPNPGQVVTFDASQSSLPFGQVVDYKWDLDGSGHYAIDTGTTPTLSHAFSTPGTTTVSVEVTGSTGGTTTTSLAVTVPAPPSAVIASPAGGQTFNEGQSVSTNLSCAEGSNGPGIASCSDSHGSYGSGGTLDTSTPGNHTYSVTAISLDGQQATATISYAVLGPPTSTLAAPSGGQSYRLDESISTSFSCNDAANAPGLLSCQDSNGSSAPSGHLDTTSYGRHTYTVTAISRDGQRTSQSISYVVTPSGIVGFLINHGDYATNSLHASIEPVWPLGTTSILISNDGGFAATGNASTFPLATQIPWTLKQTGQDRLPKTVYLRFLGAGIDTQNFTDDVVLDEQAPTMTSVQLVGTTGTANVARAAVAGAPAATEARTRSYAIKIKAKDTIVGLCEIAISSRRSGGHVIGIKNCGRRGLVRINRIVRVRSSSRPRYVRVRNSARTWSSWRRIR